MRRNKPAKDKLRGFLTRKSIWKRRIIKGMQVPVLDPVFQTVFFAVFFLSAIILTFKKIKDEGVLNHSQTDELKGIAILMVIFAHTGYFLSTDSRFMYPFSVAGGVGVNIFLFLSGFGLTLSSLKSNKTIWETYLRRLKKLFIPMWIVLALLLILDYLLFRTNQPLSLVAQNFLGFFPKADIYTSLDSPLWYFTFIFSYYLAFPLLFFKKFPFLSAGLILVLSYLILNYLILPINRDVLTLYKVHFLAFPLGMVFASLMGKIPQKLLPFQSFIKYILIILLTLIVGYTAIHSGIGENLNVEQRTSLITVLAVTGIVMLKKFQSQFLVLLGIYSYEIYLIQWPLMYRYDFLYKTMPPFLATLFYLLVLIILGMGLNKLSKWILRARA